MEGNAADDDLGDDFNDTADAHLLPARGKGQVRSGACVVSNMQVHFACFQSACRRLCQQDWAQGSPVTQQEARGIAAALSRWRPPAAHLKC